MNGASSFESLAQTNGFWNSGAALILPCVPLHSVISASFNFTTRIVKFMW